MDYKQTLKELYSLDKPIFKLGLKHIRVLLKKLNNPEKNLRCIHVAGTNGKGSVCAMIFSILTNAGYKVGMYTSPHLKKFNERIRINSKLITDKEIAEYYLKIKPFVTNQSFFELTTAIAFLYFREKKVDFVVLETGLGGRFDATNVVKPLVSVITNVDFEHTEFLGNNIKQIAYQKAGIIKSKVPVVTAAEGIGLQTIKNVSNNKNSKLIIINNKKIKKKNYGFNINNYKNIKLKNLNGKFQIENANIAIKTIEILNQNYKLKINKKNIINGLKNTKWPGRFQYINKNTIVDCAHNPSGFKVLVKELKNLNYNKLILIVGFSNDKDIKTISKIIKADKVVITKSSNIKALEPKIIKQYFNNSIIIKNPKQALNYAKKLAKKDDLILVAGSIFLVGEVI